jgi:ATP-binding cassette subfamily B protein
MADKSLKSGNFKKLSQFFKPYKTEIFFATFALLITTFLILFFGKIIKYLIDEAFAAKDSAALNQTLLIFLGGIILMAIAGYFRSSLINFVAEKVVADLRKKSYQHIIDVAPQFFELHKVGDITSRLTVDTVALYNVISSNISFALRNFLLFFGGIILLIFTSFKLSLIAILVIFIAISPIIFLGKKVKKLARSSQDYLGSLSSFIEESINGIKTIQAYLRQKKEIENFDKLVDGVLQNDLKKIRTKSLMIGLVIGGAFSSVALVVWVGMHDVLSGKITSGDLSSFLFYAVITATSLVSLSQVSGHMQTAKAALGRIFELFEINSAIDDFPSAKNFSDSSINIKFNAVDFAYPSRADIDVLKNFNLEIAPKEKLAIVGASGAGKSSILQLLLRFYDVNSGKISLNNVDVKDISLTDLRNCFSYVGQDCFIFSGTIFDNIAFARPNIERSEVENLIEKNPALHFINKFPEKLNTFVGEKGVKLSGGERQRIAIARAIIKDSPILLFDEATSALDNENEKLIASWLTDFAREKTVITIAHRLSTIAGSDRIVCLKSGVIAQQGTHEELMMRDGIYKELNAEKDKDL